MNDETKRCRFNDRRVVYIVMGLLGSGKTTKVTSMIDNFKSKGLRSVSVEGDTVGGVLSEYCKSKFDGAIKDDSIRRIFIDGCNLWREERDYYIQECEKNDVEWILLLVGRFTRESTLQYQQYNLKGYKEDDYSRQLKLWSEYYADVLKTLSYVKLKYGYEETRVMKDTQIIGIKDTPTGYVVTLGIKKDGSFIRSFAFADKQDALTLFKSATMTGYTPAKSATVMTVGRHYNNSFKPLN